MVVFLSLFSIPDFLQHQGLHLNTMQIIGAILFGIALLHTFTAKSFHVLARRHPRHAGLFHLLGEVEVVFGFWALVLIIMMAIVTGGSEAITYAESRHYTEPMFVFVVMVVAASRPVLDIVQRALLALRAHGFLVERRGKAGKKRIPIGLRVIDRHMHLRDGHGL